MYTVYMYLHNTIYIRTLVTRYSHPLQTIILSRPVQHIYLGVTSFVKSIVESTIQIIAVIDIFVR